MTALDEQHPWFVAGVVASRYADEPEVEAVVLGGSEASGMADSNSDIDLFVYLNEELPVDVRSSIAWETALYAEVDNRFWEPGDEWIDSPSGVHVDVIFRTVEWIEEELDKVLVRCEAALGYSTCHWRTVLASEILYDRRGWFGRLQRDAKQAYPEELRRAIIAKNHPILRESASSYLYQLERAIGREDLVSVNHRITAILASYFDILFAVNRMPHPGEKRLLRIAATLCKLVPDHMTDDVNALIAAASQGHIATERAEVLIDGLDNVLRSEGLIT